MSSRTQNNATFMGDSLEKRITVCYSGECITDCRGAIHIIKATPEELEYIEEDYKTIIYKPDVVIIEYLEATSESDLDEVNNSIEDNKYKTITVYFKGECVEEFCGIKNVIKSSADTIVFTDCEGCKVVIYNKSGCIVIADDYQDYDYRDDEEDYCDKEYDENEENE